MHRLSDLSPQAITAFTWLVAILFYSLGAVCMWNLYAVASNWLEDHTTIRPRHAGRHEGVINR